jgi:hypothetical protein
LLARVAVTYDGIRREAGRLQAVFVFGRPQPGREATADELLGARRVALPIGLDAVNAGIADARRRKERAVDSADFAEAAAARDVERGLLAEKMQLINSWMDESDIVRIVDELDRLYRQAERVRELIGETSQDADRS